MDFSLGTVGFLHIIFFFSAEKCGEFAKCEDHADWCKIAAEMGNGQCKGNAVAYPVFDEVTSTYQMKEAICCKSCTRELPFLYFYGILFTKFLWEFGVVEDFLQGFTETPRNDISIFLRADDNERQRNGGFSLFTKHERNRFEELTNDSHEGYKNPIFNDTTLVEIRYPGFGNILSKSRKIRKSSGFIILQYAYLKVLNGLLSVLA